MKHQYTIEYNWKSFHRWPVFISLLKTTIKETSKLHFAGFPSVWGIHRWPMPPTKGQWWRKRFRVIPLSFLHAKDYIHSTNEILNTNTILYAGSVFIGRGTAVHCTSLTQYKRIAFTANQRHPNRNRHNDITWREWIVSQCFTLLPNTFCCWWYHKIYFELYRIAMTISICAPIHSNWFANVLLQDLAMVLVYDINIVHTKLLYKITVTYARSCW